MTVNVVELKISTNKKVKYMLVGTYPEFAVND